MRFKAEKIEVPLDDPFKNDRLNRGEDVKNIALLLRNLSSPFVLAINSPWGTGKTTFTRMLYSSLLLEGRKAIYFSAWETDFASDPLLAFLGEVNLSLKATQAMGKERAEAWEKAKAAGVQIIKKSVPALIRIGTAGIIDANELIEDEVSNAVGELSKDAIEEYLKSKRVIDEFKKNLHSAITPGDEKNSSLYVFIDELDRCRPTYAIEFLERIKHLLDVEGLIFVISLDKDQLSHSVKAVYGNDFDASGYLRRFIDIEYKLPSPDIDSFIEGLYTEFGFNEFFKSREKYSSLRYDGGTLKNAYRFLITARGASLREIEQMFAKTNLVIKATEENTYLYPSLTAFLIIAREYYPTAYNNYIKEDVGPEEVINILYSLVPTHIRLNSYECALIEAFLIAAKFGANRTRVGSSIDRHKLATENQKLSDEEREYSKNVLQISERPVDFGRTVNLKSIVSRIEMSAQFKFGEDG